MSTIFSIAIGIFSFGIGTAVAATLGLTGMAATAVAGAVAGFVGGFFHGIINGLSPGDALLGAFKGAAFGALSAVAAMGVADYISGAFPGIDGHAISLWVAKSARGYTAAITKAIMHGVVRGAITLIQGGRFLANFASGFVSSAFAVGRHTFGEGAVAARTAVMALIGGVTSELTGGKFGNGALSGAFVHLFNAEMQPLPAMTEADRRALYNFEHEPGLISTDEMFIPVARGAEALFAFMRGTALSVRSTIKARHFFDETRLSVDVVTKMRIDKFHNFSNHVESFSGNGKWFRAIGRDGKIYEHLYIRGGYLNREGVFEFIKDSNNIITHRFFNPNGGF